FPAALGDASARAWLLVSTTRNPRDAATDGACAKRRVLAAVQAAPITAASRDTSAKDRPLKNPRDAAADDACANVRVLAAVQAEPITAALCDASAKAWPLVFTTRNPRDAATDAACAKPPVLAA